jgi:hypothetical protein
LSIARRRSTLVIFVVVSGVISIVLVVGALDATGRVVQPPPRASEQITPTTPERALRRMPFSFPR